MLIIHRFIYTTFVAIDANFRLKRRAISNETQDPSMSSGWGYFVEGTDYRKHILKYTNQEDVCPVPFHCDLLYIPDYLTLDQHMHRLLGVDAR